MRSPSRRRWQRSSTGCPQDFPGATSADVDAAVNQAYARFANRPIRDFIPLFVEKHARHSLAQHHVVTGA
jgi:hypothetical protein